MGFSRDPEAYVLEYLNYEALDFLVMDKIGNLKNRYQRGRLVSSRSISESTGGSPFGSARGEYGVQSGEDKIDILKNTAFIMMPMDLGKPILEDVNNTIKNICAEFDIDAVRADDVEHSRRITDIVIEHVERCEFLIADLTDARPNVYYEVGCAHALDKRPILYRKKGAELHFDLSVHNVPEYRNITDLKEQLRERFEAIMGRSPGAAG